MKKKTQHGGKRSKAGRKPLSEADKKIPVIVYARQSEVDAVGGIDKAKELAINAIVNL